MADLGSHLADEEVIFTSVLVPYDSYEETFVFHPAVVTYTHKVEGRIYNYAGNPVARKVCVFSKTTDQLLGSAISNETTGFYSIGLNSADPIYVVCFPNENEDINAKILDRIMPVVF